MSTGDNANDEFIISFGQNGPEFDNKGKVSGEKIEDIISLVMSKNCARVLAGAIRRQFELPEDGEVKAPVNLITEQSK